MKNTLLLTLSLALLVGCMSMNVKVKVKETNPRPNISIDSSDTNTSLSLSIDDAIKDSFEVSVSKAQVGLVSSDTKMTVEGWRKSLEAGFQNGFKGFFKIEKSGSDLIINITRADLSYPPTITYSASLVRKTGEVVKSTAGTASPVRSGGMQGSAGEVEMSPMAESAIEVMYEKIARDLFPKAQ